ncbi:MAG: GTPase Era [Coriobacteriales bacterium]|jgi:GTP-binding protein Era|nr:GTPase Era [Coriobacteriales bacterium]
MLNGEAPAPAGTPAPTAPEASSFASPSARSFKSGFVTLIGRPNAGKSSLINAVLGRKIAITSNTPQTTRHRFRAVLNAEDYQLILVDTPGIHKPHDALGEELNRSAQKAIEAVDAICFVLDGTKPFGNGDRWILNAIASVPTPRILVVSKTDLVDTREVDAQIAAATGEYPFDAVLSLSAQEGVNLERFVETATFFLPEGPRWFPADTSTDQPLEVIVAEFIREKVLTSTFEEVPHAVGVQVEGLEYDRKKGLYSIYAYIYVERDSQKGIIIGHKGEKIKRIGTQARLDLTHFLAAKVYLDLRVKVRKHWRQDANQIRRFGYGE